jgi:organic hydroperoxide reductase OsmC/OhrA
MYGTLAGALSGRKIAFDRHLFTATVDGRIVGIGKTIRIESITLHYDLTIPPESRDAAERALNVHPEGCPAHQSVKGAIDVKWDATLHLGEEVVSLSSKAAPT